ncbi:unnamed protein product, partial [Brenthis ino]
MFWVLIILSLACADKLDRTYLPPGAEYSGGRPEDIQVPLDYPNRNDYMGHVEIAIGIDRVGSKQVSDAQKESENTLPVMNNIITQTKPNNSDEAYLTSSDYTPNYSNSQSPIIQNIHKEQYQNQNNYRFPANLIIENNNYPSQFQTGNIIADTKSSLPSNTIQPQTIGGVDNVIYVPCNRSLPIDFINNMCKNNNNVNQYLSTLSPITNYISTTPSPSSVIPKFSDYSNPSKLPNYINTASSTFYSPTTKSPFNKNSLNFDVIAKHPERIQAQADRKAVILNYENLLTPEGYAYSFDTSNGIHGDERGIAVNGVRAKGSYSYIGDDGKRYSVVYTADENGFQPQGDHLPTPPPIPDAILKVIEKAFEDKKAGIFDDGSYDDNKYGYKKYQKNLYEPSFFNYIRGQEKKIDRLNSRNDIPLESIQEAVEPESLTKINESDSKNISELNQDNNQEVVQDDINYTYIKKMKDIPEKIKDQFYKKFPDQVNNTTYDTTNSSPITKLTSFTEMGHQYISNQNEEAKEFPSRFSEMQGIRNKNKQQVNVTPKPFMTPYVSRNSNEDDEMETSDSKEKIYEKPGQFFNDGSQSNHNNAEYPDEDGLKKQVNFSDISKSNDSFKLTNNGYFYPKVTNSEETLFSQYVNPYLPISSNGPLGFSSQSAKPNFDQYYSGTSQSTTTPSSTTIKEKGSENLNPTSFPNYSTTKLDFVNEYGNTNTPTITDFNDAYGINKENMINIPKIVSTSRPDIPIFKASYSPNIDLMISNYSAIPYTTDKNIEEDFSGPKRPHTFDPLTGYHY